MFGVKSKIEPFVSKNSKQPLQYSYKLKVIFILLDAISPAFSNHRS
jgi:hypothetical protein